MLFSLCKTIDLAAKCALSLLPASVRRVINSVTGGQKGPARGWVTSELRLAFWTFLSVDPALAGPPTQAGLKFSVR